MTLLAKEKLQYIENLSLAFVQLGLQRMPGRILGVLILADSDALSAEELAAALQASRGAISMSVRGLEQQGLVSRVMKAGVRKDFFTLADNAWRNLAQMQIDQVTAIALLAQEGLAFDDGGEVGARLTSMAAYHAALAKSLEKALEGNGKKAKKKAAKK